MSIHTTQPKPWYQEAIFYHLYPLGFCGAPETRPPEFNPGIPRLDKIVDWIPHLQSMGITALYLGPVFQSESHGYNTSDYFKVDDRLGNHETLKYLISQCHQAGIRVVLDAVFNHVGRSFFAFQDLLEKGQNSTYRNWFAELNFKQRNGYGDPFSYANWDGHDELVKLNLSHPPVRQHLFEALKFWVETYDIDGLRLDAADVIDLDFLSDLSRYAQTLKPDFWLMGEVVHGNYNRWAQPQRLHSTTNYECYKGLYSSHNDHNYFEIAHSLERLFDQEQGIYKDLYLYNFVDNHDVNRVASRLKNPAHLYPLYSLLFTVPGIPSLYYGSEFAMTGEKTALSDAPLRPAQEDIPQTNQELKDWISQLIHLRKMSPALRHGAYQTLKIQSEQLLFWRVTDTERILVGVNMAAEAVDITVDLPALSGLENLLTSESHPLQQSQTTLHLPPCSGQIWRCEQQATVRAVAEACLGQAG